MIIFRRKFTLKSPKTAPNTNYDQGSKQKQTFGPKIFLILLQFFSKPSRTQHFHASSSKFNKNNLQREFYIICLKMHLFPSQISVWCEIPIQFTFFMLKLLNSAVFGDEKTFFGVRKHFSSLFLDEFSKFASRRE